MTNSVIIASLRRIYEFIIWLYLQSGFKKGMDRIGTWIGNVLEHSLVFQTLWLRDYSGWRQGSKIHQWTSRLQYLGEVKLKHFSMWFENLYKNSTFGKSLRNYSTGWKKESVGLLSISLISMGISSLAGLYIRNQLTKMDLGVLGVVFIASIFMFLLRNGLWNFIKYSFIYQCFCRFFWIPVKLTPEEEGSNEGTFIYYIVHCIVGVGLGVFYTLLPTKFFILGIVAAIGAIIILYDYKIGIYALVAGFPFVELTEFALLLLFVIAAYLFYSIRKGSFGLGKGNNLMMPLLLFILNLVISTFTSLVPGGSIYGFKINFVALLFTVFFLITVKDKKTLYRSIMAFALGAVAVSVIGITQYGMPQNAAWTDVEMNPEITSRVVGTFGNPNVFGQYLVLAIPLIVAMIVAMKNKINQFAIFMCFLFSVAALVLTYSRGSYVGFAVAAGLFIWIVKREWVFISIPFLLISPYFLPSTLIQRIATIGNALQDSSVQHRIYIWKGTLDMVKDFGWFGIGPGGDVFKIIYPLYMVAWRKAAHPHNMFIQYVLEFGAIGFILLLCILWKLFKVNLKTKGNLLMVASAVSIIGLLVNGLVEGLFFPKVILGFWICIAFSGKIGELLEKREELP